MSHSESELEHFNRHLRARGLAPSTQARYCHVLKNFFQEIGGAPTTVDDTVIRSYLYTMADRLSLGSSWYNVVRVALVQWCEMRGHRPDLRGLTAQRRRISVPRWLSVDDVQRLVSAIDNPMYRMVVQLQLATGLRPGEATSLEISHLRGHHPLLLVADGKGGHERYVYCPPSCWELLRAHWRRYHPHRFVFEREVAGVAKPVLMATLNQALRRAATCAGLNKSVTLHCMRHTYARHTVIAQVDIATLQKQLGHRCIRSTQVYFTPDHKMTQLVDVDILERLGVHS